MIKTKPERCTECLICQLICSWSHDRENNPKRARIRITAQWPEQPQIYICRACQTQDCIQACPQEALSWDGWLRLEASLCDGCGACSQACPVSGIWLAPQGDLPLACDTCQGEFHCVSWCPTGALQRVL